MSDEKQDAVDETEDTDAKTDEAGAEESETDKATGSTRMPSMLSRESDYVQRPGFRNPSNQRTKAQKKKRKKGKKKR